MAKLTALALFTLLPLGWAIVLSKPSQYPFSGGCKLALDPFTFNTTERRASELLYNSKCLSALRIQSLYYCGIYHGLTQGQIVDGFHFLDEYCLDGGNVHALGLEEAGVRTDVTKADIEQMNITFVSVDDYHKALPRKQINYLMIPDDHLFEIGFRTDKSYTTNTWSSRYYAYGMIWFWAIVMFIGIVYRLVGSLMGPKLAQSHIEGVQSLNKSHGAQKKTIWSRVRAHFLLPPLFTYHNRKPIGQMTIPPRIESTLIVIYIVINTVLTFVKFDAFEENLYFPGTSRLYARYIADRTGMLAQANLQIVFLFGTRNNVFLWLTNMSFGTFNRFHRWVARVCVVHIIIHSAAYTRFSIYNGRLAFAWKQRYWWTGEVSTIAFCLMLGFSVLWIRKHRYDFFLLSHILLALLGLVTLYYHLALYEGEFDCWMWPAIAFWAFDRLARLARLTFIWARAPAGCACITYDETANIVRVDASQYLSKLEPRPGSFYFLYTPTKLLGWESHPFTLVTWTPSVEDEQWSTVEVNSKQQHSTTVSVDSETSRIQPRYTFAIRPYDGFTRRLRDYCQRNPQAAKSMPIMIEGPYGSIHRIRGYSDVLMIIGGTGINVAINHIHDLLQHGSKDVQIHLVWALRYTPFLQSVLRRELAGAMKSGKVVVEAYITRRIHTLGADTPVSLEGQDKGPDEDWQTITPLVSKIKFERPDCAQHVATAASNAAGKLAVLVCGPATMADDTRAAVIHEIRNEHPQTGFFEEDYGW